MGSAPGHGCSDTFSTSPGDIHPQGHLGGGILGWVQRKAAFLLLPDRAAHKCIQAEVSLC